MAQPRFSLKNPNRLRSVVSVFLTTPQWPGVELEECNVGHTE